MKNTTESTQSDPTEMGEWKSKMKDSPKMKAGKIIKEILKFTDNWTDGASG